MINILAAIVVGVGVALAQHQSPSFADRLVDAAVAQTGSYRAGDVVTWMLPHNLPHIGIVTGQKSRTGTPLVVHNIGRGPEVEDVLFTYPITGHYRYDSP